MEKLGFFREYSFSHNWFMGELGDGVVTGSESV